jgi:asparagine synthase (glutamine-hydrolysing)
VLSKEFVMSVQAGIWNFDGEPVDRTVLARFGELMKAMAPDGQSCFVDGSIALLYRPFHTTAESRQETQPCYSSNGFVLTWDGRLDNREELMTDLDMPTDGHPGDVDIVAAAFRQWKTEAFKRILGDWALSIWCVEERELILAADYMCIRHVFYYPRKHSIWWSTDLAPLVLLSESKLHLDDEYVAGYFVHGPDSETTPFREIREVPPGCFVRIRAAKICVERFWTLSSLAEIHYQKDADYEDHFRSLFRQSVRRRLRSDSPILAELSGGLDSSSIVCTADALIKEILPETHLDTLSYYDRTEPDGDDLPYVKRLEELRGKSGQHIDASTLGDSRNTFAYSEFNPLPGCVGITCFLEAERAAIVRNGGYRVVLSGLGGDEFLGGVPDPRPQLADLLFRANLVQFSRQLTAWSLTKRRPWIQLLAQTVLFLLPLGVRKHFDKRAGVEPWINESFAVRMKPGHRMPGADLGEAHCSPGRRSYIAAVLLMANKMAKQQMPTQATEEVRYPYLDRKLLEFLSSIPATQLLRPGERRSLMRRALRGIVPNEVLSRRTKQVGSRTPLIAFERNLEQLSSLFDTSQSETLGYVDSHRFMHAVRSAFSVKTIHLSTALKTVALELWLRDVVSRGLVETNLADRSSAVRIRVASQHIKTPPHFPHSC